MTTRGRFGRGAWGVFAVALGLGALGSCSKRSDASSEPSVAATMIAAAGGQAKIVADEHGFTPSSLAVPKGPPGSKVTLTFVRTSDKTCATEVVFPELKIERPLPLNVPVDIDVPGDSARTLTFQCGMGMFKGALLVK
jgi:plastocyanin domain-containing protein